MARLLTSPPRTKAASGPNISIISSALRSAPSIEAIIIVSEAMPRAIAAITKALRKRKARSARQAIDVTRRVRRSCSISTDQAVIQFNPSLRTGRGHDVMGHQDDRSPLAIDVADQLHNLLAGSSMELAGRFI